MNEVLTRAEMEAQFDGEWVIVADPEIDEDYLVQRGRIVYHGKDEEALCSHYKALGLQKTAYLHFGGGPERIWLNDWITMGAACEYGAD